MLAMGIVKMYLLKLFFDYLIELDITTREDTSVLEYLKVIELDVPNHSCEIDANFEAMNLVIAKLNELRLSYTAIQLVPYDEESNYKVGSFKILDIGI